MPNVSVVTSNHRVADGADSVRFDRTVVRTLRTIDWRFVLPSEGDAVFEHLILAGGSDDESDAILETGLARRVTRERSASARADAVVVRANAGWSLREAAECLSAGGALYFEVDRLSARGFARTPARLERELRRSGCTPTGVYWVFPRFARPQIYLPLNARGAFAWYVRHLFVASTPIKRAIKIVLRVASHIGTHAVAAVVPRLAVTARKTLPGDGSAPVLGRCDLPGVPATECVYPLVLLGGENDLNRVALLPFGVTSPRPLTVLKVGRRPDLLNAGIEREQEVLRRIGAYSAAMSQSLPSPLGTFSWGRLVVGGETCADGHLVAATIEGWRVPRRRKIEHLHAVLAWVSRFHNEIEFGGPTWTVDRLHEWVSSPIASYVSTVDLTESERRLFSAVQAHSRALIGQRLPIVWLHWGLAARNIYRAGQRLTIVDWESGSPGPSLFDVLYFVLNWYFAVENCRRLESRVAAVARLFVDRDSSVTTTASIARAAIANYTRTLRIDSRFVAPMLAMMFVFRASGHSTLPASNGLHRASGRTYAAYLAVLAQHMDTLFAADLD